MKQLEKSIKLLLKKYLIILPLFVATVIPAVIERGDVLLPGFVRMLNYFREPENIKVMPTVFSMLKTLYSAQSTGIIGFILQFFAIPATIGMIIRTLYGETVSIEDIIPSIKGYLKQYLIYWGGSFAVSLGLSAAAILTGLVLWGLTLLFSGFKVFLLVILYFIMLAVVVLVTVLLSLWLPAMVADDLNVLDAAKKSVELMKHSFISILMIYLTVNISAGILQFFVRTAFGWIPVFGDIAGSLVPAITAALLLAYYIILYRSVTGKEDFPE